MNIKIPNWKNDETVKVTYGPSGEVVIVIEMLQHQTDERVIRITLPNSNVMTEKAIGLFVAAADVFAK